MCSVCVGRGKTDARRHGAAARLGFVTGIEGSNNGQHVSTSVMTSPKQRARHLVVGHYTHYTLLDAVLCIVTQCGNFFPYPSFAGGDILH